MSEKPPIAAKDFEQSLSDKLTASIWEDDWRDDYQDAVSMTIQEMRYIANLMRAAEGLRLREVGGITEGRTE